VFLSPLARSTFDETSIFGFKNSQAGVEQIARRYYHDVVAYRDLVATENLSYQAFGAISPNGATQFFRRRNTEPPDPAVVGQDEGRAVAAPKPDAAVVYALELGAPPDAFS